MTPQESSMLNDLIRKIQQTRLTEKDPEAEQLLQQGLGNDADALYMLAQTVLVQNIAIEQAKGQIQQLQQQVADARQHPPRATSFLGSLLGHNEPPPPPPPSYAQQTAPPSYAAPQYQTVPTPQYQGAPFGGAPMGGPPSFLRSAATTAAGVAAGALAFEGVESLLHGFGHGGGYGGGFGMPGGGYGGFGGGPVEETVVNNYYDRPDEVREHHEHEASYDDRPDGARLDNATFDPRTDTDDYDDQGQNDNSASNDDVAFDDSGDSIGSDGSDDGSYS